jgi:molybdopterin-containing oxidoreductase family membrane subunit
MKNINNIIWNAFLILVLLAGIYGVALQVIHGHSVTGISNQVPWGVYISAFTFFIGISTGATLIGFIIHVFKRDDLRALELRAVTISLITLVGALMFLISDVGSPLKMLKVPFLLRNPTSVFFYSSLSYYAFGSLLLIQFITLVKINNNPQDKKLGNRLKWISLIAFPFAMGIVLVPDGALFSFVKAREFWNRPLLLPHFANASLVSAMALMVIVSYINVKIKKRELLNLSSKLLMRYLLIFLTAGVLFLDVFDILVLKYSAKPEGLEAWYLLISEHLFLFLLNILGLLLALILLLTKKGNEYPRIIISSILIVLAISAYRYNLIIIGQEAPLFEGDTIERYSPTIIEIIICAGITSFAILAYQILMQKFEKDDMSLANA